ncbi:hypothetical protein DFH27DRAFT_485236 [Peziza echinospora]|nr:hypothetical protein DFH27DRAFT_485236 [Peziza echinospora]
MGRNASISTTTATATATASAAANTSPSTTQHVPSGLVAGLSRWSILHGRRELPMIPGIKSIHIYDFDNTLFQTPQPNPRLWNFHTVGQLQQQEFFANGGWWHDSRILSAIGEGVEKEEENAWEGWWNEKIVDLVVLSMANKDTLKVLLTGRSTKGFSEIIERMVKAKKLDFDMICLKPEASPEGEPFQNTMHFKQALLTKILETYVHAEDLKIYEDRAKHVTAFEKFFAEYNATLARLGRKPLAANVVQVLEQIKYLDPLKESIEIVRLLNEHNEIARGQENVSPRLQPLILKKHVFFTAYKLSEVDSAVLLAAYPIPQLGDIHTLANIIMITPRKAHPSVLQKAGGLGNEIEFEVISTGVWQDRIWAVTVRPVDPKAKCYTDTPKPIIVLGHRRGVKPQEANLIKRWTEVEEGSRFKFKAVVWEKKSLRIEGEDSRLEGQGTNNNYGNNNYNGGHYQHNQHHNNHFHHHHNNYHQGGYGHHERGGAHGQGGNVGHEGGGGAPGGYHRGGGGGMGGRGRGRRNFYHSNSGDNQRPGVPRPRKWDS